MSKAEFDPTYHARRKIVGVICSGTPVADNSAAAEVGGLVARLGCHLLTGGGGGSMEAVCRAFRETPGRAGSAIGVIRAGGVSRLAEGRRAYAPKAVNRYVEIPIFTHLPLSGDEGKSELSRNHINVLASDVLVALEGGAGTLSEVELAVEYGWPVVLFLKHGRIGGRDAAELIRLGAGLVKEARGVEELESLLRDLIAREG